MNRREVAKIIASTYGDGSVITCKSSDLIAAIEAVLRERDIRASRIAEKFAATERDDNLVSGTTTDGRMAERIATAILNEEES